MMRQPTTTGSRRAGLTDECGAVLVLFAIITPGLLFLLLLAIDVGNWYVHHRHLQMQADAAVVAGGARFGDCFSPDPTTQAAANTTIKDAAIAYAGNASSVYNFQVGGGAPRVTTLFNSKTFADGSYNDSSVETQEPCQTPSLMLDVKQTEANVPYVLANLVNALVPGADPVVPAINARARVEVKKATIVQGGMPLAVPEVNPKYVTATFVNDAGGVVGFAELSGPTATGSLNAWTGSASVNVPAGGKVGVRIGIGQVSATCSPAAGSGGTGFVCLDSKSFGTGLVTISGWSGSSGGTAADPGAGAFEVWPVTTCSGSPFFSDFATGSSSTCDAGVQVVVHPGSWTFDPALLKSFKATVTGPGFNRTVDLTESGGVWTTGYAFAIPVDTGPYDIDLQWQYGSGSPKKYAVVQRLYSASDDSGPVKVVTLSASGGTGAPYSLEAGSRTVGINVAIEGTLRLSNDLIMLRLTGTSRTSAVSCYDKSGDGVPDPGFDNFRTAIVKGCNVPFQINAPPAVCPDDAPPPGPSTCVPTQTGEGAGPTLQGLDDRFASCPAHTWPTIDAATDPRVVKLMITDFSALGGSGTTDVPVTNLAAFYVSGWTGSKCSNNGKPPFDVKKGAIWGYFVQYTAPDPFSGGTEVCDPTALTPCIPVLVK